MRLNRICLVLLIAFSSGFATESFAQRTATVEEGLDQLAAQVVERDFTPATTVAVLPFVNADGTCSVFGSYLVDELTLRLFGASSTIEVIERSRIEALLAEMKIGASGLLDPTTRRSFGNLSGVSSVALGTITVLDDDVRLIMRLVETESGKTIAAAAVSIPSTDAVMGLILAPMDCAGEMNSPSRASQTQPPSLPSLKKDGLTVQVENVSLSENSDDRIDLVLRVTNDEEGSMFIAHGKGSFVLSTGTICDRGSGLTNVSGIGWGPDRLSEVSAGETVQYTLTKLGCNSNDLSATGAINLVLLAGPRRTSFGEVRFQIFDIPFSQD